MPLKLIPEFPLLTAVLLIVSASSFAATRLEQAEQLFRTGNGHAAEKIYRTLIEEITSAGAVSETSSEVHVRALSGLLGAALRYGDHPLAEKTIAAATRTFPSNPALLTRAGEYLHYRGRLKDTRSLWSRALELDPEALEARYRLAELERSLAPQQDPKAPYPWFEKRFQSDKPIPPNDLEWIGRACLRLEKYEWDGAQKAYQDALDASAEREAILVAKADLWLDRYDEPAAIRIYTEAHTANRESLPALLGLALAHRERGDLTACKKTLDQALFLNPRHPLALALLADISFYDQQFEEGQRCLDRGYATNPVHPSLLATDLAYAIKRKQTERARELRSRIEALYPNPSEVYLELAECLERNYLFEDADRFLTRALETEPAHKRAVAARAMLAGRISAASAEGALASLAAAFKADPFHIRLYNTRNLFVERAEFELLSSENFNLRIPKGAARVYGKRALETLEKAHAELSERFQHRHRSKVLIEFYEDPEDFSIRIAGLPGAGLAGVCFGDTVILRAPHRSRLSGINWGNVLRHELTHTFSLALSEHRLPRWFTEGLSVREEWDPGVAADPLLAQRLSEGDLVSVADLDLAFHRPRTPMDFAAAYAQAGEAVRLLTDRLGFPVNLSLLEGFRSGGPTAEIVPRVTGLSLGEIDREVRARVEARVSSGQPLQTFEDWVRDPTRAEDNAREEAIEDLNRAVQSHAWKILSASAELWLAEHPSDLPFLEAKALASYRTEERRQARKTAESILAASRSSLLAHQVLGWLDRDNRKWDRAAEHLLAAYRLRPRFVGPGSPILEAEKIYRERGRASELMETLSTRLAMNPTDVQGYLELATLAGEAGRDDVRREAVRQATFIEPYMPEVQLAWGNLLLDEGDPTEAAERFKVAAELDEKNGLARYGLARAYLASGSEAGAIRCASEALRLDPTLEEVRDLMKRIREKATTGEVRFP